MALIPDFEAIPNSGVAPMMVAFTDLSSEAPDSWEWDFGDGSPHSTIMAPVHLYDTAGVYTVTLTVVKELISYTKIISDCITVTPKANFYVDFPSGLPGLISHFFDTSTGVPTSWEWDFGDGSPHSYEQNPFHKYTNVGNYTVSLAISRDSFSNFETKSNFIFIYDPPTVIKIPDGGGFTRSKGPSLIFD